MTLSQLPEMSAGSIISEVGLKNIKSRFASVTTAEDIAIIIDKTTSNGTKER